MDKYNTPEMNLFKKIDRAYERRKGVAFQFLRQIQAEAKLKDVTMRIEIYEGVGDLKAPRPVFIQNLALVGEWYED